MDGIEKKGWYRKRRLTGWWYVLELIFFRIPTRQGKENRSSEKWKVTKIDFLTLWLPISIQTPDKPQQSRLPPPIKPTVDNEEGSDVAESEAREEDMETNDVEEITAERLRSTYHSSDMALAFERLVRPKCVSMH